MISNEEVKDIYEQNNTIYVPEEYYDENYKYILENDTMTIITDKNCTTNYNTTNCDCYRYNVKYNIIMTSYQCNRNPNNNNLVQNRYITTDINSSNKITNDYTKDYILIFCILILAMLFVSVLKRNSRNI